MRFFGLFYFLAFLYLCLSFLLYFRYRFCLMKLKHSDLPTKHSFIHEWQFTKHFSRMGNQICPKIFFSINHPFRAKQVVVGYLPLPTPCTINLEQIMKAIKSPGTVARGNWDSGLIISYDIDLWLTSAPRLSEWMVDQITVISWSGLA